MAFMKKQVNLFLLFLIIVTIGMIAGMSIVYQERLSVLGNDYLSSSEEFTVCNASLTDALSNLTRLETQLSANIEDVDKTVTLFEEKTGELQTANDLIKEKDKELQFKQVEIDSLLQKVASLESQIAEKNVEIAKLLDQIDDLQNDVAYYQSTC